MPADALSRPIGEDIPEDSWEVALLPSELFINMFDMDSDGSLEHHICYVPSWMQDSLM